MRDTERSTHEFLPRHPRTLLACPHQHAPLHLPPPTDKAQTPPKAIGPWALDSGGFSQINLYGAWTISTRAYIADVKRFQSEIGNMLWAAPQDWMCEPTMLARTGKTVAEHQRLTISNFLELQQLAPEEPWIPVLQGWTLDDYHRHADAYDSAGIQLQQAPLVGVGTICRRQATAHAELILRSLASLNIKLHAFGLKTLGIQRVADSLESSDSMAWSRHARYRPALPGHRHSSCANCLEYAEAWAKTIQKLINQHGPIPRQTAFALYAGHGTEYP